MTFESGHRFCRGGPVQLTMCASAGEFIIDAVHRLRDELREGGAPISVLHYLGGFQADLRKQLERQQKADDAPAPY